VNTTVSGPSSQSPRTVSEVQYGADGTITPAYIHELLLEFFQSRWYGTIEVKLEAGRIVFIRKIETIKQIPSAIKRGNDRGEAHHKA